MSRPLLFVLISLASFRLQRIVSADTWPASEWLRNRVRGKHERELEKASGHRLTGNSPTVTKNRRRFFRRARWWSEFYGLITCPWCLGWWVSGALVLIVARYFASLPLPLLWWPAVAGVVGMCGMYDKHDE